MRIAVLFSAIVLLCAAGLAVASGGENRVASVVNAMPAARTRASLSSALPLSRPTQRELDLFHRLRTDSLQGTVCPVRNSSRAHCRDPRSYVRTNEARSFLFAPYIRNLGGGYAGVGADGNYTFIAHARSHWVWLLDHDPVIVRLHFALRVFILESPRPSVFVARFQARGASASMALLRRHYHDGAALDEILYVYKKYRPELYDHYRASSQPNAAFGGFGWLRNPEAYGYIRTLYSQDRIALLYGDLLKPEALRGVGESARRLGTPVRIYYPSNAEEYWAFTRTYRENVRALPFDRQSVVIRSISPHRVRLGRDNRWHARRAGRYWHYVVHSGLRFQERLADLEFDAIDAWKPLRMRTRVADLSLIGVRELE